MIPAPLKLLLVAGARPNFMKVAPLIHAIQRHNASLPLRAGEIPLAHRMGEGDPEDRVRVATDQPRSAEAAQPATLNPQLDYRLVHTGQHYDPAMSDVFFAELGIPAPDYNLEVGSGSHAAQTARIMERFEPALLNAFHDAASDPAFSLQPSAVRPDSLPDWLVVFGDVNSTLACTLVASKLGVKVAHVEAGLRSFDRTMPEEINRIVTDTLADLLLTPSEDANDNLRREGVPEHKIKLVGNIMIDSLVANLPKARASTILRQLNVEPRSFAYVTLHRPSNVDQPETLSVIMAQLKWLAERMPVIMPLHPRTRKQLAEFGLSLNGAPTFRLLDPLGYHDSLCLTEHARLVLTDSGGLQEESTYFRTSCLTLRPNTERPVTLTRGSNQLTTPIRIQPDVEQVLKQDQRTGQVPPLWDGQSAERIIDRLLSRSGSQQSSRSAAPPALG